MFASLRTGIGLEELALPFRRIRHQAKPCVTWSLLFFQGFRQFNWVLLSLLISCTYKTFFMEVERIVIGFETLVSD